MEALLKKQVPANLENLNDLMEFIASYALAMGFERDRIGEIEIAAEEALVNIFNYAYQNKDGATETGDVEVACGKDGESLIVSITDEGLPFNILAKADPDISSTLEERSIGGLGIYMIKQFMNGVRYNRENGKNVLTLTINKHRG
ncbi:MAG: ATP-binding protein [Nitrospirae bacterium]|nr:ATP-binding protein [Nitrospirota bacterium]